MAGFGSPCGACKFLRRKCVRGCVFAPYFAHEQGAAHFAAIHKVFGASNVSKLLMHLPVGDRCEAAVTIAYEAQARLRDPIYGCVAHIFALQQQVVNLQAELSSLVAQAAQSRGHEQGFLFPPDGDLRMPQPSVSNDRENIFIDNNGLLDSTPFTILVPATVPSRSPTAITSLSTWMTNRIAPWVRIFDRSHSVILTVIESIDDISSSGMCVMILYAKLSMINLGAVLPTS
uniref:LOB domain-containing protein n=1 Tax=Ananas comosus var. bracteatus TaxID=296719 RepID=A0A6V7PIZ4_ANACO|nr:unnamed protein product [Ananas comosus var. bracteatus]